MSRDLKLIVYLYVRVYQGSRIQIEDGNRMSTLRIGGAKPPLLHMRS